MRRDTSSSAFDLPQVGKPSVPGLARVPTRSQPAAKNPFASEEPTVTSAGRVPLVQPPTRKSNVMQKRLAASAFDDEERTNIDAVLGRSKSIEFELDEETHTQPIEFYDGITPADEVTDRETWRLVKPPVTSKPRRRAGRILWTLIDQFAVAHNPRYQVSSPVAESRAHIFAWDISLAMDCEIPHNRGGRELTLSQTIDWVRFSSPQTGWKKVDAKTALAAADRGELSLVISRDPRARALAIVRPGGPGPNGLPRVATAGRPKDNDLGVTEAVGAEVEYYWHA